MAHAREPDLTPVEADSILDFKMARLHAHFDPETGKRENTSFANMGFAVFRELR